MGTKHTGGCVQWSDWRRVTEGGFVWTQLQRSPALASPTLSPFFGPLGTPSGGRASCSNLTPRHSSHAPPSPHHHLLAEPAEPWRQLRRPIPLRLPCQPPSAGPHPCPSRLDTPHRVLRALSPAGPVASSSVESAISLLPLLPLSPPPLAAPLLPCFPASNRLRWPAALSGMGLALLC